MAQRVTAKVRREMAVGCYLERDDQSERVWMRPATHAEATLWMPHMTPELLSCTSWIWRNQSGRWYQLPSICGYWRERNMRFYAALAGTLGYTPLARTLFTATLNRKEA